ncbi:hypothetical protein R1flu_004880 [Riccia fluitans]|uniref:C2H2-type domain-containing protein n=1 Tax=Riccia fluitans TaxID=41844 RepID=A0ABD1YRK2_9MARC
MEKVNGEELSQKKPFIVEGDVKREPCYSWIFKVRCVYCGSKFELVPSKRNLEHNLQEHLSSKKHRENVEFQLCSTSHGLVHSGAKGRPKKFDPKDLKRQRCIDSFFVGAQSSGSVSNPSSTEDCEKEPSEVHSDFSLLCWGFWFMSTIVYGGNVYDVNPFLDDQKRGCTCACYNIPKTSSFRFRCTREDDAVVKCGSRDSLVRIRWEARRDTLIGFCGDKDNHVCKMGLEVEVGSGESSYSKIVESFEQKIQGIVLDSGDVYALGDQDPIHNGKKMINPLDRSSYPIVLGDFHACLEHVQLVYKLYSHGLNIDDVMRRDRQNWAGHLLGSDSCEQFFSHVGGMRGYERNYDFGDLLDCASGLNRLAVLEYGEDVVKLSKAHVKQRSLWAKLHPLPPSHAKPDLSDFARLATDDQITEALKVGLQQAQTLLTQLNMSPHAGVRDKTWWRTPWTLEKELGIFGMSSSTQEPDHERFEVNEVEEVEEMPNNELSSDLWDIPEVTGAPSTMEADMDA